MCQHSVQQSIRKSSIIQPLVCLMAFGNHQNTLAQNAQSMSAECVGFRLVAVTQQQGKTRRTLYAALSQHLKLASDDAAIAHAASMLQQLPLLGTAK